MEARQVYQRLNQHRQWANRRLMDSAAKLEEEELRREHPIGQGSVWRTLTHLFGAEYVWLQVLQGDDNPLAPGDARGKLPGNQEGADPIPSLDELRRYWEICHSGWDQYLEQVTDDELEESVIKKNSVTGQPAPASRSDILIHVHTHAQYTTAQAVNMMRHLGVQDLPDVMMITLARSEVR